MAALQHALLAVVWLCDCLAVEESAALSAVRGAKAGLIAYYGNSSLILDKAPVVARGSDVAFRTLVTRLGGREAGSSFVVGVTGSSVTAGHDGFGTAAWPAVAEGAAGGAFGAAGLTLEVRNQAVGGQDPNPTATFCLGAMVGEDADVVVREYNYWDFQSGLSDSLTVLGGGRDVPVAAMELFLRNALRLPKRPAVLFLSLDASQRRGGGGRRGTNLEERVYGAAAPLKAYDGMPLNALSAFGPPFNHLRDRAPEERVAKVNPGQTPGKPCSGPDVAACPVDIAKQDGTHERARNLGHPDDAALAAFDNHNLFVNWHPAPLGHEVIGHQVAFYLLEALEAALLLRGSREALARAARASVLEPPLPAPVLFNASYATSTCAYEYEPRVGTSVAAWGNGAWQSAVVGDGGVRKACADKDRACGAAENAAKTKRCYDALRACSYRDTKRGLLGNASAAPLVLTIPRDALRTGIVSIGEASYGWSKPVLLANWKFELKVAVNDAPPCSPPQCRVEQTGYVQSLVVRTEPATDVRIALSVAPLDVPTRVCGRNNKRVCSPAGDWKGYGGLPCVEHKDARKLGAVTRSHGKPLGAIGARQEVVSKSKRTANAGDAPDELCVLAESRLRRPPADVHTFVAHVVAF